MKNERLINKRIAKSKFLPPPALMRLLIRTSRKAKKTARTSRSAISAILKRKDPRKMLIFGPCSFHDLKGIHQIIDAIEELPSWVWKYFFPVIRLYYDKPRSTIGWKGYANDPDFIGNGTSNIAKGICLTRKAMTEVLERGYGIAAEFVDPFLAKYFADQVSFCAIGARTSASQTHRIKASGVSMPFGIKNDEHGTSAVEGLLAAMSKHTFPTTNDWGLCMSYTTTGNNDGCIILRGEKKRPNFDEISIMRFKNQLEKAGIGDKTIVVDCSHDQVREGKKKFFERQIDIFYDVINQIATGNDSITGLMLEVNVREGAMKIKEYRKQPVSGISLTDACISIASFKEMVIRGAQMIKDAPEQSQHQNAI